MRRSTATRARISARLRDESGVALILALTIMLILTIMLVSVIGFSSAGSRNAQHSNASEEAYALAGGGCQQRARRPTSELSRTKFPASRDSVRPAP